MDGMDGMDERRATRHFKNHGNVGTLIRDCGTSFGLRQGKVYEHLASTLPRLRELYFGL